MPRFQEGALGGKAKKSSQTGGDKRSSQRRRTRLRCGKIVDPRNSFLIDCQIYDLSDGGARLRLFACAALPEQIQLFENLPERLTDAKIAWQRNREIGICFMRGGRPRELTGIELTLLRAGYNPAKRGSGARA
jgi:hypothetical protein